MSSTKEYGWEGVYVFDANDEKQPFIYSIGLEETYDHPEIMIFGLNEKQCTAFCLISRKI